MTYIVSDGGVKLYSFTRKYNSRVVKRRSGLTHVGYSDNIRACCCRIQRMYSFSYAYTHYENNVYHHRHRRHRLSSDGTRFSTTVDRTLPVAASRLWKTVPQIRHVRVISVCFLETFEDPSHQSFFPPLAKSSVVPAQ